MTRTSAGLLPADRVRLDARTATGGTGPAWRAGDGPLPVPRLACAGRGRPVGTVSSVEPAGPLGVGGGGVHVVPQPPAAPVRAAAPAAPGQRTAEGKGRGKR